MSNSETNPKDLERLQRQVDQLTELVHGLSLALDRMSQSQALISGTVANLVEVQEGFAESQANSLLTLKDNSEDLERIGGGVNEILRRLPPPAQENKRGR